MSYTLNRLETNWSRILPILLQQWPLLNAEDLNWVAGHFDRLVEVIRNRYGGRVEIVQEAAIRDTLNQILAELGDSPGA